ncbi:MAG TPA: PIN domain-containing protein [Phycisphaerae bacterium]|jgi:predicted nucleic acid-binding protein
MRIVFLDSVGLLATWDTRDQWHQAAAPVFATLVKEGAAILTTELILAECGNAASRKPYRPRVPALRKHLVDQDRVIWIDRITLDLAWRAFQKEEAGAAGIVDQTSFLVMRRLGITEAFTNDTHFKAAGFNTLF